MKIDSRGIYIGQLPPLFRVNQNIAYIKNGTTKVLVNIDTITEILYNQYKDNEMVVLRLLAEINHKHMPTIKEVITPNLKYYNFNGKLIPIKICEEVENKYLLYMNKDSKIVGYVVNKTQGW